MAGTRAKALARCKQPMGTGGHCCQQSADKGQTAHGSDLHLFRGHVWRGVWKDTTKVKDKMSAVVKALRSILAHIRDCSSDVLYGTLGYFHGVFVMLPNCWQHRSLEHGGWPMAQGAAILIRGVAVVSAGLKVSTDWCGNQIHY
jgi:hypothetical protein